MVVEKTALIAEDDVGQTRCWGKLNSHGPGVAACGREIMNIHHLCLAKSGAAPLPTAMIIIGKRFILQVSAVNGFILTSNGITEKEHGRTRSGALSHYTPAVLYRSSP